MWSVHWDGNSKEWMRDATVRFKHRDTGAYLSTHAVKFQRPIPGHTEVFAVKNKGSNALWRATEGVYFPDPSAADQQ